MQLQAMTLETERRRKMELTRIVAALLRLDSGDYGYCLKCDEDLPRKRLEFDPTTAVCIACARAVRCRRS